MMILVSSKFPFGFPEAEKSTAELYTSYKNYASHFLYLFSTAHAQYNTVFQKLISHINGTQPRDRPRLCKSRISVCNLIF